MKKLIFSSIALLSLSVVLISWGATGHRKISESSSLSFNSQMQDFQSWVVFLRDHASDADSRKSSDPTESPKHFIDIDNYSDFLTKGRILQTLDSANTYYGSSVVLANGILPWATKASFDSLRNCLQRHDFTKAKIFAADLGHYVADGHMPLHITANYDGKSTGNDGIHSRYETTMINAYVSQIIYTGESISEIGDVNQYIFNYLYTNNGYCDSVLIADTYAKTFGSTSSSAYKTALWNKSKGFTIPLFKSASHALAELIYTAWIQAGSPSLILTGTGDPIASSNAVLDQNMPNPFTSTSHISYTLKENTKVLIQVRDGNGRIIATLVDDALTEGRHTYEWTPDNIPAGIYYLVLKTGESIQVKKMIYSGGI
ncbi:MAG: T9SS type A sorting domain-containing protein [Lentimicrobiaceae bacterium]